MNTIFKHIKGDLYIWAIIALLAIFSFLPVFSASSNLANLYGKSPVMLILKHAVHLAMGFGLLYVVHKLPSHYFKRLSTIGIFIVIILLVYTLSQGTTIGGANASRWIQVAGFSFQTSTLASVVLLVYTARYLANKEGKKTILKVDFLKLWFPVGVILMLILPANFSTAAIIFVMVLMLSLVGGYPLKYLMAIIGSGIIFLSIFVLSAKAFPDAFPNRVETWVSRIENFASSDDTDEEYQIQRAKMAIASGGITGLGPGKSVQRNFLPQSSSDFIYAIIIEEWGMIVGVLIMLLYVLLLFRMVVLVNKTKPLFEKLVVVGVGFPIIFQAFINMAVATGLAPTTGQTLPLISSGGSSIWMTCLALGIILSVSANPKGGITKAKIKNTNNPLDVLRETI